MFMDCTFEQVQDRRDIVWIDVRSENEFAESTIPGAVNIPLFSNEERAVIGTVYKMESPKRAREVGLTIASSKLPPLLKRVEEVAAQGYPIIFCWRGGMRSKTVATLADLMGLSVMRLSGGYRAYRQYITEQLQHMRPVDLPPLIVLHGMTGVGKTTILRRLEKLGEPVLDLELWAGHRGSVFGAIGLHVANQRQFDSRLYAALHDAGQVPYFLIEAESRRIGRAIMPEFLFEAKRTGKNLEITAPIAVRVKRTLEQYMLDDADLFHEQVIAAAARIEKRLAPDTSKQVKQLLEKKAYEPVIELLLVNYYDPMYRHAMESYEQDFLTVDAENLDAAVAGIQEVLHGLSL